MEGDPYRFQSPAAAPVATWWAGGIAKAILLLAGLLWIGTLVGAYFRESWGVLGAELAIGPTGFGAGCLYLARRTRYAASASARVVAPLALGGLVAYVAFLVLVGFFGTIWTML